MRHAALAQIEDLLLVTHTECSRHPERLLSLRPSIVIVDEAHRFRHPRTKRYATLAAIASEAPLMLVSATPINRGVQDLEHLLRLFLREDSTRRLVGKDLSEIFGLAKGGDGWALDELISAVVIRRLRAPEEERGTFGRRPAVSLSVMAYEPSGDEQWLWHHLSSSLDALSLKVFGADWPRALLTEFVLRRWESGPRALHDTLRHIVAFHRYALDASERGGARLSRPLRVDGDSPSWRASGDTRVRLST